MIYYFQRLVRIDRRYIHAYHHIKIGIRNIRQHIVLQTCRHILYKHSTSILIAPHKVVLFELQIVGAAVGTLCLALEMLVCKLRYLLINVTENIL